MEVCLGAAEAPRRNGAIFLDAQQGSEARKEPRLLLEARARCSRGGGACTLQESRLGPAFSSSPPMSH